MPGSGRSSGIVSGNPLQYSCLKISMDRGAWQATVHRLQRAGHDWATEHIILRGKHGSQGWNKVRNNFPDYKWINLTVSSCFLWAFFVHFLPAHLLLLSRFSRVRLCVSPWPWWWQPTRLPRPWDSPGKNPGAGCHFLLQCMKVQSESEVAESCPTLSEPMDCSLPGSSIHGIFQATA